MRTYLVSFDTRKTESVDWVKPLNNYLISVYGNSDSYQTDIKAFDKLRLDFRGVSGDESGIKIAFKYYSQLELLDLRVPFLAINRLKKIKFKWYDSFDPTISHEQESIAFEKASVLFNCGMLMARVASQLYEQSLKSGGNEEKAKKSIKTYQEAAGIFQYLTENFVHAPSADLSKSTCQFLIKLMLAQSHEVFMYRLINTDLDQTKNSLISKLCSSAALHYEDCNKMLQILQSDEVPIAEYGLVTDDELDGGDVDQQLATSTFDDDPDSTQVTAKVSQLCLDVISYKLVYYKALTYYYAGLQLEKAKKYGNAIAYMNKSLEVLESMPDSVWKTLSKSDRYIVHELFEDYKFQMDSLTIRLEELNKDNDYIYHEIIPTQSSLEEIKPMDSSKIIPIGDNELFKQSNETAYSHFLTNVVPMNIHELMSLYSEEKSELLRNNMDLVDVSNEEVSSALEYLNMPIAVVNLKQIFKQSKDDEQQKHQQTIDPLTISHANEISASVTKDEANKDQIIRLRKDIWDNITEIESILSRHVEPSFTKFKDELIQLKRSLYNASNLDKKVFENITTENQLLLNTLRLGPKLKQFDDMFSLNWNNNNNNKSTLNAEISLLDLDDSMLNKLLDTIEKDIKHIEDLLNDLNVLKANKAALIDALKKEIHSDDISNILILNSRVKLESEIKLVIFPEELKKFSPYDEELDKLVSEQKRKVKHLTESWNQLIENDAVKNLQTLKLNGDQKTKEITEKINDFYNNNWKPYSSGLKRSADFYQQLYEFSVNVKNSILDEESKVSFQRQKSDYFNMESSFNQINLGSNQNQNQRFAQQPNGYQHQQSAPALPPKRSSQQMGFTASQGPGSYPAQYPAQYPTTPTQQQPPQLQQHSGYGGANQMYGSGPTGGPPPVQYSTSSQQPPQGYPPNNSGRPPNGNDSQNPNNNLGLIYNNPSTYQPNMYNFFSSK